MIHTTWVILALVTGAVAFCCFALGAAAGYLFGHRDWLEDRAWLDELPPVPLDLPGEEGAALAPLDPDGDTTDRLIFEARQAG